MKKSLLALAVLPLLASCGTANPMLYGYNGQYAKIETAQDSGAYYSFTALLFATQEGEKSLTFTLNDFEAKKGDTSYKAETFVLTYNYKSLNGVQTFTATSTASTVTLDCNNESFEAIYVAFNENVNNDYDVYVKGNKLSITDSGSITL